MKDPPDDLYDYHAFPRWRVAKRTPLLSLACLHVMHAGSREFPCFPARAIGFELFCFLFALRSLWHDMFELGLIRALHRGGQGVSFPLAAFVTLWVLHYCAACRDLGTVGCVGDDL